MTSDALPTVQIDGVVWDQVINGNTVYAGGEFANARPAGAAPGTNQTPRSNLLSYNLSTGTLITSFNPSINAQVKSVALSPDKTRLYVGGSFTTVNGQNRYRLAAFDTATGALVANFAPSINATVNSITVTNTAVYVGGGFTKVGSATRQYVAAFNPTNGALLGWAPAFDKTVQAVQITPDGSRVIVAGAFATANGATAPGLAAIDAATGATLPYLANTVVKNYGTTAAMLYLKSDGVDTIYGGGYWFGGTGNFEGVFSVDANSGSVNWLADCHGDSYDAQPIGNTVYAVSHFHHCENINAFPDTNPRNRWLRANALTKAADGTVKANNQGGYYSFEGYGAPSTINWFPTVPAGTYTGQSQGGWTIEGNSQYVVMGGEFPSVNGTGQQGLVRFGVPSVAPKAQGPQVAGKPANPSLLAVSPTKVRVKWQTNHDRDDQNLTYDVFKQGVTNPIYTTTAISQFWNRPTLSFDDTTVSAGQSVRYRIRASDPDGNSTLSEYVTITVPATINAYVSTVLDDNPTNYWRMGAGALLPDYAGSSDLVVTGSTAADGSGVISGDPATAYDGSSSSYGSVQVPAGPDTFTAEAWFKTTSTSGGKIVGFGDQTTTNSSNYDRHVYLDNSGRVLFGVHPGGVRTVQSATGFNDGQWHHVAAQLSSAGQVLYVDGIKVGENTSVTSGQGGYAGYWRVGGDNIGGWTNQPSSNTLNGSIDEVAIYPTALTKQQIREHITTSGRTVNVPPTPADTYGAAVYDDEPSFYWRLDDTTGTAAKDSSENALNGEFNGGVTKGGTGALSTGSSITTDGGDSGAHTTGTYANPLNYSEEIWFKTTTTNGGKLIGFGAAPTGGSDGYDRHVYMEFDGKITFGVWTGFTNTITTGSAFNDGQWHHLVATQNTSTGMALYLDGQLAGTNGQTSAQDYTGYWRIGSDNTWNGSFGFAGQLDEAAVYPRALTAAQVQTHYAASGVGGPVNEPPVAAFTSSCTDLVCSFDGSTSSDPDGTVAAYAWNYGDGTPAGSGQTSTHTYGAPGNYTVTLTVTDDDGSTNTVTHPVTVVAANVSPVAAFTSSCTGLVCALDASTSSDPDGTIASYAWNFGDTTTGTGASPSHTYTAAGTYSVTLTVTDNQGGTNVVAHDVTVTAPNQAPEAQFTSSCTNLACSFNGSTSSDPDGTIASYAWDFGDGGTATVENPNRTYATPGTYTVTLTVTDNRGATDTFTDQVTVSASNQSPTARFTSSCTNLACSFNGSTSSDPDGTVASYGWNFGDTTSGTGATPNKTYTAAGTYTVTLTVTDNQGGTDTVTHDVTVTAPPANQAPTARFTSSCTNLACSFNGSTSSDPDGTVASYAWNFGDTTSGTGATPNKSYTAAGTYTVTLTVTDDDGATNAVTHSVTVTAAPAGPIVSDNFNRTASNWGSAQQGGAWSLSGASSFSTDGTKGIIRLTTGGASATASLNSVSAANVDVSADVTLNPAATGGGSYTTFIARRVNATTDYRLTVRQLSGGKVNLNLARTVNNVSTNLGDYAVPGLTYAAGDVLHVSFVVSGTGTTSLQAKVWKNAAAEPASPQLSRTDTTAVLQAPGGFGIRGYVSGTETALPMTIGIDNLLIVAP